MTSGRPGPPSTGSALVQRLGPGRLRLAGPGLVERVRLVAAGRGDGLGAARLGLLAVREPLAGVAAADLGAFRADPGGVGLDRQALDPRARGAAGPPRRSRGSARPRATAVVELVDRVEPLACRGLGRLGGRRPVARRRGTRRGARPSRRRPRAGRRPAPRGRGARAGRRTRAGPRAARRRPPSRWSRASDATVQRSSTSRRGTSHGSADAGVIAIGPASSSSAARRGRRPDGPRDRHGDRCRGEGRRACPAGGRGRTATPRRGGPDVDHGHGRRARRRLRRHGGAGPCRRARRRRWAGTSRTPASAVPRRPAPGPWCAIVIAPGPTGIDVAPSTGTATAPAGTPAGLDGTGVRPGTPGVAVSGADGRGRSAGSSWSSAHPPSAGDPGTGPRVVDGVASDSVCPPRAPIEFGETVTRTWPPGAGRARSASTTAAPTPAPRMRPTARKAISDGLT